MTLGTQRSSALQRIIRRTAFVLSAAFSFASGMEGQSTLPPFLALGPAIDPAARPFAAFDADGDGDQDLLTSRGLQLNDGGGRFFQACCALPAGFVPQSLLAAEPGDLDNDGDQDLVVLFQDAQSQIRAQVIWNLGPAALLTLVTPLLPPAPAGTPYYVTFPVAIVIGDLNGDGFPDIATSGFNLIVHLQTAPGAFTIATPTVLLATGLGSSAVLIGGGDMDGDGLVELICDAPSPSPLILANVSTVIEYSTTLLTYTAAPVFNGAPGVFQSAARGDFDGDGRIDLTVSRVGTAFGPIDEVITKVGATTVSITLLRSAGALLGAADVNNDGRKDVLRHTTAGSFETLDVQTGAALVGPIVWGVLPPVWLSPWMVGPFYVAFDADQDGDDDVVGARFPNDLIEDLVYGLQLQRSNGVFAREESDLNWELADIKGLFVADFDGDGDLDLARPAAPGGSSSMVLRRNDGKGRFADPAPGVSALTGNHSFGFVADFDGDGDLDIFTAWTGGPGNLTALHVQGPSGIFTSTPVPNGIPSRPAASAVLDYDGDGDLDILYIGSAVAPAVQGLNVMLNIPGGFAPATTIAAFSVFHGAALFADADSIPDFVVASSPIYQPFPPQQLRTVNVVSGADGSLIAGLGTVSSLSADGAFGGAITTGDLDGDNDTDILYEGLAYLRSGAAFVAGPGAAVTAVPSNMPFRLVVVDVDQDGLNDVLDMNGFFQAGLVGGGFAAPVAFETNGVGVLGDFDRDGDPDMLDGGGRLRTNVTAGLFRGRTAAIGRTSSIEARGPANASFDLFVSPSAFAQTPIVVPGWGNLWIDPSQAVYLGTGLLDVSGRAEISFAIPNAPTLSGLSLWWQAVIPQTSRLTNAVPSNFYLP